MRESDANTIGRGDNAVAERAGIDLEIVASGLLFPEGPVVLRDGSVLLVEIARGTVTRIADGKAEVVAEPGGGPNGAALGPDGALYICNNGGRFEFIEREGLRFPGRLPPTHRGGSIQRLDLATGRVETLYESCDGRRLGAPNDLVFDREGGFWFTDHGTGHDDGALFHARSDGSEIHRWCEGQAAPNGVGLSPDEGTVFYADTHLRSLYAFELAAPGVLADAPSRPDGLVVQVPEGRLFDSLAVEADGRVCIGTLLDGGVTVCTPGGTWRHIAFPDPMTTNIAFGGHDMRDAYLAFSATGRLARTRWPRPGLKLNYAS
jgi:gluconolactonase